MKKPVRLSIKLSSFTTLMVVVSMLGSFYLAGGRGSDENSAWIFIFSFVSFVVALLYTLFLDRVITIPVQRLMEDTATMVDNDYQRPVRIPSNDEIGSLAATVEALRRSFLAQRRSLQELNDRLDGLVEERTAELAYALSNLRQTQQELLKVEKLASIGKLAAGIAHEINNPAAIILTRTGFLLDAASEDGLSDETVENLKVIDRQIKRIARITNDLLIFSRQNPLRTRAVDCAPIIMWSLSSFLRQAQDMGVTFSNGCTEPLWVKADAAALEQVFGNLIKNALDAMEERGGNLVIRAEHEEASVTIYVEDSGPGIDPNVLPRIFDPFFTTKKVGRGSGLGLAITYGILEELGGHLRAENREEGGARFCVSLPRATPRPESSCPEAGEEENMTDALDDDAGNENTAGKGIETADSRG